MRDVKWDDAPLSADEKQRCHSAVGQFLHDRAAEAAIGELSARRAVTKPVICVTVIVCTVSYDLCI